jgi:preprotein translocase subunit SecB
MSKMCDFSKLHFRPLIVSNCTKMLFKFLRLACSATVRTVVSSANPSVLSVSALDSVLKSGCISS